MKWLSVVLLLAASCRKAEPETTRRSRIAFAVAREGARREVMVVESDGSGAITIAPGADYDDAPAWSAEGLSLYLSRREGQKGIWEWQSRTGEFRRLNGGPWIDTCPAVSPNGRSIAFMSNRDGNWEIYVSGLELRRPLRLTQDSEAQHLWPAWSPDGMKLAFVGERFGGKNIYTMNAGGQEMKALTDDPCWNGRPAWSPDGKRIAWASEREGKQGVFVMDADGKNPRRLTPPGVECGDPAWSPDGRRICFACERSGFRELWVMNPDGSGAHALTKLQTEVFAPVWSPFVSEER